MEVNHDSFSSHEHPLELCRIATSNSESCEHNHLQESGYLFGLNKMCSIICSACKEITSMFCSACNEAISRGEWFHTSKDCNYNLHLACSQTPRLVNHPLHPHPLILHRPCKPREVSSSLTKCGACGLDCSSTDPCYRCLTCNFDTHIHCAMQPLFANHQSHEHPLHLVSCEPFRPERFSCGICNKSVATWIWFYRCGSCKYNAHHACATGRNSENNQRVGEGCPPLELDAQVSSTKTVRELKDEIADLKAKYENQRKLQDEINTDSTAMYESQHKLQDEITDLIKAKYEYQRKLQVVVTDLKAKYEELQVEITDLNAKREVVYADLSDFSF